MQRRELSKLALGAVLTACALMPAVTQAQTAAPLFPAKTPLRIVVGYPPGGATDRVARLVADKLQAKLGSPVIVENKPGAGGRLSAQYVKNAPAAQPAILLANPAVMVVAPLVFHDSGYDPEKDFRAISEVNRYEFGLAVASAVPVKQLSHLLAWIKANPQQANFGVPATGSLPHFFALMLGGAAKVPVEVVGYKGSGPLLTDLMGGQVQIAVDTFDTQIPRSKQASCACWPLQAKSAVPWRPTFPRSGTGREPGRHGLEYLVRAAKHGAGHGAAPVRAGAGGRRTRHPAEVRGLQSDPRGQQRRADRDHAQGLSRAVGTRGAAFRLQTLNPLRGRRRRREAALARRLWLETCLLGAACSFKSWVLY